jgi:hypothetical protein
VTTATPKFETLLPSTKRKTCSGPLNAVVIPGASSGHRYDETIDLPPAVVPP